MLNYSRNMKILFIVFICLMTGSLQAQFIIKQIEYTVPISYSLIPEDAEMESEEEETMFFMTIPTEKLKQAATEEGLDVEANESTIYVDGDNFALEDNSEMGSHFQCKRWCNVYGFVGSETGDGHDS